MNKNNFQAALMIIFVIGLNACSEVNETSNVSNEKPVAVSLSTVSADNQPAILASGFAESAHSAHVSTRIMGRITNIFVKVGDQVEKDQLLANISDEDIQARKAQSDATVADAESTFTSAQKDYDRFANLYKQQSATAKEFDNATLQYNSAKAKVDAAKQVRAEVNSNLSYSRLIAPFAGVITQKFAEVGNITNPGMAIFTIDQHNNLQISATIAESEINSVHVGDIVHIKMKASEKSFEGKIIQINPSAQFSGGRYIIKINIPEAAQENIYAGMFATVSIPIKNFQPNNDVTMIPLSAVVNRDGLTGIYTVSAQETALLRWIRLGKTYGSNVEVISGLSKDEKFINATEGKLYNGVPVVVQETVATSSQHRNK